jgi:hypothetical protein
MICTWLTEIYLNKLNELEAAHNTVAFDSINKEFEQFLTTYVRHLDHNTTFNLMSSHGRTSALLFYATLIKDTERVLTHYLNAGKYKEALDVLKTRANELKDPNNHYLYYKYAGVLMGYEPAQTVQLLMRCPWLEPRLLLPALMSSQSSTSPSLLKNDINRYAIEYLEWAIYQQRNTDTAVHNYLLSLYVELKDPTKLLNFISARQRDAFRFGVRVTAVHKAQSASCVCTDLQ